MLWPAFPHSLFGSSRSCSMVVVSTICHLQLAVACLRSSRFFQKIIRSKGKKNRRKKKVRNSRQHGLHFVIFLLAFRFYYDEERGSNKFYEVSAWKMRFAKFVELFLKCWCAPFGMAFVIRISVKCR